MSDILRLELTPAEREELFDVVAYEFSVQDDDVTIRQCWTCTDELYSNGVTFPIPARIWAIAAPWLAERVPAPLSAGRTG